MRGASLALLAMVACAAGAARGQYVDYAAWRQQHLVPGARPSVRLAGMGGLGLVIEDENNEINLSDFGGNLAGMAEDRDGWSLESWGGSSKSVDDYIDPTGVSPVRIRQRVNQDRGGIDVVYRKPGRRALGITTLYDGETNTITLGPRSKNSGPNLSVFWNEILAPFSLAARGGTWSDKEDLVTPDIFGIGNASTGWFATLASAWNWRTWQIGGQLELDRSKVNGLSDDPSGFHTDTFKWNRPLTQFRLNLIRPERVGRRVSAGFNLTGSTLNGNEQGMFSWADRFPDNPSRLNYLTTVPTFAEKERDLGLAGRAMIRLPGSLRLGGMGSYEKFTSKITIDPGTNFAGSRAPQDTDLKGWRLGAGLGGTWLNHRLRIGAEGYAEERKLTARLPREVDLIKARTLALNAGAELLLPSHVALRAGYVRGAYDANLVQPLSLYKSDGVTVGLGYVPKGGVISLDGAFRSLVQKPDYSGGEDRKTDVQELELGARLLF